MKRKSVHTLDDGHDGALLNGGGAFETIGVDSTEELALEVHRIEGVGGLIVVGFDLTYWRSVLSVLCSRLFLPLAARGAHLPRLPATCASSS